MVSTHDVGGLSPSGRANLYPYSWFPANRFGYNIFEVNNNCVAGNNIIKGKNNMKCENCGNEHDGSYGSGRFCSKHCRCSFNAKKVFKLVLSNAS